LEGAHKSSGRRYRFQDLTSAGSGQVQGPGSDSTFPEAGLEAQSS
jgi:hypothetical protein